MIAVLPYWLTRPLMPPKVSGYTRITNDGGAKSFRVDAFPVIVTDGLRIYFAEAANSGMRSTLNQASASGGETSPVPSPSPSNRTLNWPISLRIGLTCCSKPSLPANRKCLSGFCRRSAEYIVAWVTGGARRSMVAERTKDRIRERPRVVPVQC